LLAPAFCSGRIVTAVPREVAWVDIQEPLSRFLHRPPGRWLAQRLVATPVTPIHVTILAGIVGVAAGVLLILGADKPWLRVAGGIALLISCMLDCADGELARARGRYSMIGMILDGVTDNIVGTAVFLGMAYDIVVYSGQPWSWLLGIAAGLSAAAHAWVYDLKKKQYLNCLGLARPEEIQPVSHLVSQLRQARRERHWAEAFLLGAFIFFRSAQSIGMSDAAARDPLQFRNANRGRMRAWSFMGASTHFFLLYVAALISSVWPPAFVACALVCAVGLNVLWVFLLFDNWAAA
jgi:phosphatidylglycerophosphate synthase